MGFVNSSVMKKAREAIVVLVLLSYRVKKIASTYVSSKLHDVSITEPASGSLSFARTS